MSKSLINSIQLLEIENDYLRNKLKKLEAELKQSKVMVVKPEEISKEDFPTEVFHLEKSHADVTRYNVYDAEGFLKDIIRADSDEEAMAKFKEFSDSYSHKRKYVITCAREEGIAYALTMLINKNHKSIQIWADQKCVKTFYPDENNMSIKDCIDKFYETIQEIIEQKENKKPEVISTQVI